MPELKSVKYTEYILLYEEMPMANATFMDVEEKNHLFVLTKNIPSK